MSPDRRKHRGPHPDDVELFGAESLGSLRLATEELCWLLGRGYPRRAAGTLVGNRHRLSTRQRIAVGRASCSDSELSGRRSRLVPLETIRSATVAVDGFNLLVTVEAALSGGVVLECRDGCLRDVSSVHGSYRRVEETVRAAELIGRTLETAGCTRVRWLLDRPVSNSGRLAELLGKVARDAAWKWTAELVDDPDPVLMDCSGPVASSDSRILDSTALWVNLAAETVDRYIANVWKVDLRIH